MVDILVPILSCPAMLVSTPAKVALDPATEVTVIVDFSHDDLNETIHQTCDFKEWEPNHSEWDLTTYPQASDMKQNSRGQLTGIVDEHVEFAPCVRLSRLSPH
jgi:hypothetical protein